MDLHECTIGSLVAKKPEYASVFEKLGLDYCCKGNRTLKEGCDEKQLNLDAVLEILKQLPTSDKAMDWEQLSLREIVEHIVDKYHVYAREELARISQLLKKVNIKHGQRYLYISELLSVFDKMKNSLLEHMDEEEEVVFPLMIDLQSQEEEIRKYLSNLDQEHLETGEALEIIKKLTHDYTPPADACLTHRVMLDSLERLERNLHQHIHCENQILFPRVKALLCLPRT